MTAKMTERHSLGQFRFGILLVVTLLALIWLFLGLAPLPPNDLWWHMAAGRVMVEEQALITTNRWAYTLAPETPYVYQSWLSELLLYGLWLLGGVPLLSLARMLAVVSAMGLVAWHALRRSGDGRAGALALLLTALISWNNWTLRPQTLVLPLGAAFIVLIGEYLGGRLRARWLMLLPLVMLLWVNSHGSFVLGAAWLGAAWLGNAYAALRGDRAAQGRVRPLLLAGIGCLAALFCNPLGLGIFGYVRGMLGNDALQRWFVEWQPPEIGFNLASTDFWFYATILLFFVLLATSKQRVSAVDLLWLCGMAWLAFSGVRYAIWFALALMPLLADLIGQHLAQRPDPRLDPRFSLGIFVSLGALIIATLPWFSPSRVLGNEALFAQNGPDRWLLSYRTPIAASEWLAANPIPGRFWTEMSLTSYTMWALPDRQIFADLRVELFPSAIWEQYFAIYRGDEASLPLIDRWQISHFMLDRSDHAPLYNRLIATGTWCEPYRDQRVSIVARCR